MEDEASLRGASTPRAEGPEDAAMTVHAFPNSVLSSPSLTPQPFPAGATAVIYRPGRSAMTSGTARTRDWKLRFERQIPPFIEPLMGWTGSDDTLPQIELTFPSVESAIAYATRQGLSYTVQGTTQRLPELRVIARTTQSQRAEASARRQRLEWVEQMLGRDVIQQGFGPGEDPAALYADPNDVLRDERLTSDQKKDMLQRWALEAYQLDLAFSRLSSEPHVSRLQEVIDALIELDGRAKPLTESAGPVRSTA
jgi:hypothetical protein